MSKATLLAKPIDSFRQPWELYALIGTVIALSAFVTLSNISQVSSLLLALLAVAVGQALLLPPTSGVLGGLAAAGLWVLLRRSVGIWTDDVLAQSLSELAGLSVNVALAVRHRAVWQRQQRELEELRSLQQLLIAAEAGTGLLTRQVGDLRIEEEVGRSRQFNRPLGLLIVELLLDENQKRDTSEVYQAVERRLVSAALVHDVPFRFDERHIGLLLPERGWDRIYNDVEDIIEALNQASFLDIEGNNQAVSGYAKLHYGLGIYDGKGHGLIDIVQAAKDSLEIARDLVGFGEARASAFAIPASPITEEESVLLGEEE